MAGAAVAVVGVLAAVLLLWQRRDSALVALVALQAMHCRVWWRLSAPSTPNGRMLVMLQLLQWLPGMTMLVWHIVQ